MASTSKKFPLNLSSTGRYLRKRFNGSQENLSAEMQRRPIQTIGSPNLLSAGGYRHLASSDNNSLLRSSSATDVMAEAEVDGFLVGGDSDDLPALTQSMRLLTDALTALRTTIGSAGPDVSKEALQSEAQEKLTAVLSSMRTAFGRFPSLRSAEILKAAESLICRINGENFDGSSQWKEEIYSIIDSLAFLISNSLSDCLTATGCDSATHLTKTKSLNCLTPNENKLPCEFGADVQSGAGAEGAADVMDDSILYHLESGVEIALQRAQSWSKYAKELTSYIERRINLWGEFTRGLMKLAKSIEQNLAEDSFLPMQSLFCTALSQDVELASMSQGARSLILNQTFVTTLNARKIEHDKLRKNLKYTWTKQVRKLHDSISNLRKAKTTYISRQQDYERLKEQALKAENESLLLGSGGGTIPAKADVKLEKKRKQEDDAMQKAIEAETAYKHCVRDANDQQKQLEEVKCFVLRSTRDLLVKSDAVLKESTCGYFKLMNTIVEMSPAQFQSLHCLSQQYDEGSHYFEFISQLQLTDYAPSQVRTYVFEPYAFKSTDPFDTQSDSLLGHSEVSKGHDSDSSPCGSILSLESSPTTTPFHQKRIMTSASMADLANEDDHARFDLNDDGVPMFHGVRLSLDAQTHQFQKLRAPSKCGHCNSLVYLQGAECEKCGIASHKRCLEILRGSCGVHHDASRGTTAVPLDTTMHEVPSILVKCIQEIDKRGLSTKGIYRISSVKSRVEQVCQSSEMDETSVDLSDQPANVIANVLKLYLRQLPEPLLTYRLYADFVDLAKEEMQGGSVSHAVASLNQLIQRLPTAHLKTCNILMYHLNRVSKNQEVNQMTSTNLGIVFGPTLLRPKDGAASLNYLIETPYQTRIIELLIENVQEVFGPDEVNSVEMRGADVGRSSSDIRRKKLTVKESGSESTSPGYSSWYAPEITSDLLGELAKEEPHFLQLQEGQSLASDQSPHRLEDPSTGQLHKELNEVKSTESHIVNQLSDEKEYFM